MKNSIILIILSISVLFYTGCNDGGGGTPASLTDFIIWAEVDSFLVEGKTEVAVYIFNSGFTAAIPNVTVTVESTTIGSHNVPFDNNITVQQYLKTVNTAVPETEDVTIRFEYKGETIALDVAVPEQPSNVTPSGGFLDPTIDQDFTVDPFVVEPDFYRLDLAAADAADDIMTMYYGFNEQMSIWANDMKVKPSIDLEIKSGNEYPTQFTDSGSSYEVMNTVVVNIATQ